MSLLSSLERKERGINSSIMKIEPSIHPPTLRFKEIFLARLPARCSSIHIVCRRRSHHFRHGSLRILEYSLGQDQSRNHFIYLFFV